jgi:hypothetical protein
MFRKKNDYIELIERYNDIIEKDDLKEFHKQRVGNSIKISLGSFSALVLIAVAIDFSNIGYPANVFIALLFLVALGLLSGGFIFFTEMQKKEFEEYLDAVKELETRKKINH